MNGSRKHKITTQRAGKGNQPPGNTPGNTPGGKPSNEREKWGTSNGWAGEGHVERAESWGRVRNVTAVDRRTHGNIAASVLPKNATLDRRDDIPVLEPPAPAVPPRLRNHSVPTSSSVLP